MVLLWSENMKKMEDIIPVTIRNLGIQKKYNAESITLHWKKIGYA